MRVYRIYADDGYGLEPVEWAGTFETLKDAEKLTNDGFFTIREEWVCETCKTEIHEDDGQFCNSCFNSLPYETRAKILDNGGN